MRCAVNEQNKTDSEYCRQYRKWYIHKMPEMRYTCDIYYTQLNTTRVLRKYPVRLDDAIKNISASFAENLLMNNTLSWHIAQPPDAVGNRGEFRPAGRITFVTWVTKKRVRSMADSFQSYRHALFLFPFRSGSGVEAYANYIQAQ